MDAAAVQKMGVERVRRGDRALTLREAEEVYGIPEHRLRQYRSERVIDFFKLGKALFISERSLVDFLEKHREPAASVELDEVVPVEDDHSGTRKAGGRDNTIKSRRASARRI